MIKRSVAILALLTALNLVNYLDRYLVVGVGTGLQAELHIGDGAFGDITTAFMWGYFITSPIFGWLGDRFARKGLIAFGVAVWSLATMCSGMAHTYQAMLVARIFVGVGEASYATLSPTIIDDIAAPSKRNRWLAIFYSAIPVGAALGFLVGGQLEKHFGWRSAFFLAGGPGLVLASLVLLVREPARRQSEDAPAVDRRFAYIQLVRLPAYDLTVVGYVAQTFALGGFAAFAVQFLRRMYSFAPDTATLAFGGILVVTGLGGTALGGWLADRLAGSDPLRANLRICAWSSLIAAPLALLALLAPTPAIFLLALAACQVAIFLSTSPINAAVLSTAPAHLRANAMALSIFAIHLMGDMVSPPLIGRISDANGATADGLRRGMLMLPVALAVSAVAWFRGAALQRLTPPDTA